jgi:K+-transporting ATPase ATPase A chain
MTANGTLQILVFFAVLILLTKPLGVYMAKVFQGEKTFLHPILGWLESLSFKLVGVKGDDDQPWTDYAVSLLVFSAVSLFFTYAMLRLQGFLPLNPQHLDTKQMPAHLAFNTAASFTTNTNWQSYSPELTMSYLSNMVALAIHNWASAAVGIAVAIALVRGFARKSAMGIGSFWVDAIRATIFLLLPICLVGALIYVWQGVPMNFLPYQQAVGLEGGKQTIAMGPVASQEIIKQLGTNGGGFFNANSAHPFENPTPFSNFFTLVLIWSIPAALTYTFGKMVGNVRQGWAIFGAMSAMFLAGAFVCNYAEQTGNPHYTTLGVQAANMEGKEVRFGIPSSTLFATVTTGASCGAVNSMHDSYTPIGGMVPLFNMMTSEVVFGGVGAGLYGMLLYAILAVFIAGLMVGRTPEYLCKKIERFEVQMAMLAMIIFAGIILLFTALAANLNLPKEGNLAALNTYTGSAYGGSNTVYGPTTGNLNNNGAHGFSEILYTYTEGAANNGSAFAGITANTPYYDFTIGLDVLMGRFLMLLPMLAIAGSLARKKFVPITAGTFQTDNGTFVMLLVGVVIIVGALTFIPALALGPVVEHFQMLKGLTK